ncbi:MAG: acyl-CoA thioesterase [Myxococcaceae bacterium]
MLATYLARISLTLASGLVRDRVLVLDEVRMPMRVWPQDIDTYVHVNNGVYLTLMDQGRLEWTVRTGVGRQMLRRGWKPVLGAATVRFRRELRAFERFELVTRVAAFDEKWLYFAQRFEREGVVHADAFVKIVTKKAGVTVPPEEILAAVGPAVAPPQIPEALSLWMASQRA